MARKKIREYDAKRLLKQHIKRLAGIDLAINSVQVRIAVKLGSGVDAMAQKKDFASESLVAHA